jgi:hypothetical protein
MAIFNSKTAQSSFRVQPRSLGEKEMAKLETQMGRRQQAEGYQHMYIYIHYIYIIYTLHNIYILYICVNILSLYIYNLIHI